MILNCLLLASFFASIHGAALQRQAHDRDESTPYAGVFSITEGAHSHYAAGFTSFLRNNDNLNTPVYARLKKDKGSPETDSGTIILDRSGIKKRKSTREGIFAGTTINEPTSNRDKYNGHGTSSESGRTSGSESEHKNKKRGRGARPRMEQAHGSSPDQTNTDTDKTFNLGRESMKTTYQHRSEKGEMKSHQRNTMNSGSNPDDKADQEKATVPRASKSKINLNNNSAGSANDSDGEQGVDNERDSKTRATGGSKKSHNDDEKQKGGSGNGNNENTRPQKEKRGWNKEKGGMGGTDDETENPKMVKQTDDGSEERREREEKTEALHFKKQQSGNQGTTKKNKQTLSGQSDSIAPKSCPCRLTPGPPSTCYYLIENTKEKNSMRCDSRKCAEKYECIAHVHDLETKNENEQLVMTCLLRKAYTKIISDDMNPGFCVMKPADTPDGDDFAVLYQA